MGMMSKCNVRFDQKCLPQSNKFRFSITIHEAEDARSKLWPSKQSYARILNAEMDEEIIRYDLRWEDFSIETAVVVGELYRHGKEWKFNAIGSGYQGGLGALVKDFGLN